MIFYFSASGNSKYVADCIADAINDQAVSISRCLAKEDFTFQLKKERGFINALGIVCPTYAGGTPSVVDEFLEKLQIESKSSPYVFFVATYGSKAGRPDRMVNRYLSAKGYPLDATFDVKMPDTWTPLFDLSDEKAVARTNEEAEVQIAKAVKMITRRTRGDFMKDKLPWPLASVYHRIGYTRIRRTANFSVSAATCIECGLCAAMCPTGTIEMKYHKPQWTKDRCAACLGCLHRCPTFAIQYGSHTADHGQYVNPHVKVDDLGLEAEPAKPAAKAQTDVAGNAQSEDATEKIKLEDIEKAQSEEDI